MLQTRIPLLVVIATALATVISSAQQPTGTSTAQQPTTISGAQPTIKDQIARFHSVTKSKTVIWDQLKRDQIWRRPDLEGLVASPKEDEPFPASQVMYPVCSATIVGPHVLVTAGHCMNGYTTAEVDINGKAFSGPCDVYMEGKANDWTLDLALCRMEPAITGMVFESLATENEKIDVKKELLLTGYGKDEMFNKFVVGSSVVSAVIGHMITTSGDAWTSKLDSGGGVYVRHETSSGKFDRRLVAVNSMKRPPESFATLVTTNRSRIDTWKAKASKELKKSVLICGHDSPCTP